MKRQGLFIVGIALATLLICLEGVSVARTQDSPEFLDAMARAERLMLEKDFKNAVKAYREANRSSEGLSFDCQLGLAKAYNRIGATKNAKDCARRAIELAETPIAEAAAENQLGKAFFDRGDAELSDLQSAVECFQRVLELAPEEGNRVRFSLGVAMLTLGRDEEGIALLEEFLSAQPEGREAEIAQSYIANPLRARVPLVPEFELVTLDGEYLTSDDLLGKVVLIDFWGTWCAPCVSAIPHLRRLSHKSSKFPFILLSVSHEDDESELREFVVEHEMNWPQTLDEDRQLIRAFNIRNFPTYILVDSEGEIVYRHSGWSERIALELNSNVSRQLRIARKLRR